MALNINQSNPEVSGADPTKGSFVETTGAVQLGGLPRKGFNICPVPFWYMWHPHKVGYSDARGWHYKLTAFHHDRGLNGVDHYGRLDEAIKNMMLHGYNFIRPDDERLEGFKTVLFKNDKNLRTEIDFSKPGQNFLKRYMLQGSTDNNKIWHYTHCFQHPMISGGKTVWKTDRTAYNEFMQYMIDAGICPEIQSHVFDTEISRQESIVSRLENDFAARPSQLIESRLTEHTLRLAKMRDESVDEAHANIKTFVDAIRKEKAQAAIAVSESADPLNDPRVKAMLEKTMKEAFEAGQAEYKNRKAAAKKAKKESKPLTENEDWGN